METIPTPAEVWDRVLAMNEDSRSTLDGPPFVPVFTLSPEEHAIEVIDESDLDESSDSDDFVSHIAAGSATSVVFLILLVVWLLWFRRRRKQRLATKTQATNEFELRRVDNSNTFTGNDNCNSNSTVNGNGINITLGSINTNSHGSHQHNHNNYASNSPQLTQIPIPVPSQPPRAARTAVATPITTPMYPSPAMARQASTIILPSSNAAYFTGTGIGIDPSDRVSVADTSTLYHSPRPVGNASPPSGFIGHHEEEPPPPYQPRDAPNG